MQRGRRRWAGLLGSALVTGAALGGAGTVARADTTTVPDGLVWFWNGSTTVVDAAVSGDSVTPNESVQPDGSVAADVGWFTTTMGDHLRLTHVEGIVPGDQDATAVLGRPGRLHVDEVSHDATGRLTALAAEWTLDPASATGPGDAAGPTSGLLRWHSTVSWSAVGGGSDSSRFYAEPGIDATRTYTLTNGGPQPLDSLPIEVTGQRASDWSVDPGSACLAALPLASQQTCDLVLRLRTDTPGSSSPSVVVHRPGWDQVLDPVLATTVVGPPATPVLQAYRTPLGVGLAWPGSGLIDAQVQRSADGGATWTTIADAMTGDDLSAARWTDPAPPPTPTYRVRVTAPQYFPGEQRTYSSDWSTPVAPASVSTGLLMSASSSLGAGVADSAVLAVDRTLSNPSAMAVSPDGSSFVVAGTLVADGSTVIARYPVAGGVPAAPTILYRNTSSPRGLAWSPDGRRLAWNSDGGSIVVAPADGSGPYDVGPPAPAVSGWLPDSQVLVAGHDFYDTVAKTLADTGVPGTLSVSPSGRTAVAVTTDTDRQGSTLTEYSLDRSTLLLRPTGRTGSTRALPDLAGNPTTVLGWSPDGRALLVLGIASRLASVPVDGAGLLGAPHLLEPQTAVSTAQWLAPGPTLTAVTASGTTSAVTLGVGRLASGVRLTCALDDAPATSCSGTWSVPTSARTGRHSLTVTATEPSGRSVVAARTWQTGAVRLTPGLGGAFPAPFQSLPAARRVLDTRSGIGAPVGRLAGGRSLVLTVPGLPADATAVTVNVTAVGSTTPGSYLTLYPADAPRPTASSVNVADALPTANLVTVGVSPGGRLAIYEGVGSTDVVVDLQGYYSRTSPSRFTAVTPYRVVDTRSGLGGLPGPVGTIAATPPVWSVVGGTRLDFPADSMTGLALTLTAVTPPAAGYLSLSADTTRPATSNLNFAAGRTAANAAIEPVHDVAASPIVFWHGGPGAVQTLADVTGWFSAEGSSLTPVTPLRVLDTRSGLGGPRARLAPGQSVTVTLASVPQGASAVALNVTAVSPSAAGYLVAYPAEGSQPPTSTVSYAAGRTVSTSTLVKVDGQRRVTVTNAGGTSDVLVDLQGYFSS